MDSERLPVNGSVAGVPSLCPLPTVATTGFSVFATRELLFFEVLERVCEGNLYHRENEHKNT